MTQQPQYSSPKHKPIWVGLTGGISSGKSTVASILSSACGFDRVDTDAIARALTNSSGIAMKKILSTFGREYALTNGALDRVKMRELVFQNPTAKSQLEQILHPLIQAEAYAQAHACQKNRVVLEIPLLVESAYWRPHLQAVWVVDCSEATQIQRTQTRSGLTLKQVRSIIATQTSRVRRLACADAVFFNEECSINALEQEIIHFVYDWNAIAL